ncbi:hypothetical protein GCM10009665_35860 [Kitasatospora nipponensis]|uniref:Uncharacterized protein n=1 Tax=Kitasatospora nipponensis TaxID=258049 RepID=A0ABN1W9L7_9ACTN
MPAGKWSASTCWPTTESGVLVKVPAVLRPVALSEVRPSVQTTSTRPVTIHTLRARRLIQTPTCAQRPVRVGSVVP